MAILLNKIYNEDCMITLDRMDDNFIDLTVTSPPYNVDLGNNKYNKIAAYDIYRDNKSHNDYMAWLKIIFSKIYQKTVSGGRCVINIGSGKNGKIPTVANIITTMADIGWLPLTTIVWDKKTTSNRAAWGSWNSPSSPSFPTPFEFILIFAKDSMKLLKSGVSDLHKEEFTKWAYAKWEFGTEKRTKINHPSPFPIELPTRCIKMLSWVDSIIYDPFSGSGTTAIACIKNKRNFIGSEISAEYCTISQQRIDSI